MRAFVASYAAWMLISCRRTASLIGSGARSIVRTLCTVPTDESDSRAICSFVRSELRFNVESRSVRFPWFAFAFALRMSSLAS